MTEHTSPMSTNPKSDRAAEPHVPRWSFARAGYGWLLATLIADQAHKWWMIKLWQMPKGQRLPVTSFLDLVYVINPGISYSLLSNLGQWPLIGFAAVATTALCIWIAHAHAKLVAISLGLIAGGAIGNAIDRLHLGGVADFFSLHIGDFYWYVFNIADVAIVAGVAGLLYDSLIVSRKNAGNAA